jgi:hypothetical protein
LIAICRSLPSLHHEAWHVTAVLEMGQMNHLQDEKD